MSKQVAILGDMTNYGGRIITASGQGYSDGAQIALLGDLVSCPRCSSTGRIIEGADNFIIDGKPVAYDGCIVACKCTPVGGHRILALNSTMYVGIGVGGGSVQSNSFAGNQKQFNSENNDENNLIRIDARRLLQCADELCEKHLYHDDIKQAFKQDIESFANDIVERVDSGAMAYEQGAEKIKAEEDDLLEQSLTWLKKGLYIFGGLAMITTGAAMCTTGIGCVIGAYVGAHGVNSIQEGITGQDGFLKSTYQAAARELGLSESVGTLVYDLVDIGLSVHGKLELVPKINELGMPVKKLWHYGRQDLVRHYTQMKEAALLGEIGVDIASLISIFKDVENVFFYNKETDEPALVVPEPEKITNVRDLADSCQIVIVMTFADEVPPHYYLCTRPNGEQYKIE
ncbi:PAAR domain-containing protein [Gilliamella sp. B14384G15]|uniref:PAAR domain-containing protein n=1 Tax=unclassified Gilliamella TaxID=2685620 RepID=UPI0018DC6D5C|nr:MULTISPECIES: PAAR domain-containing protein [unclassified Gilliamella]MBI0030634.1 PAAR domain-containing protein [Gilliamella sp. B14384G15]MBI0057930.1 PAAR domain-containing protein [Gilliamella sp. B14384G12]